MTAYYHGGPLGRERGAFLLPPAITGVESMADLMQSLRFCHKSRVYVTTHYAAALLYASVHKQPAVYVVEPVGVLMPDEDCSEPGLSYHVEKAKVLRVIKPNRNDLKTAREALLA